MSDDGFDFRRAAERRDTKRFEPPPWEREAFEELERKRAKEAAETEVAAAVAAQAVEECQEPAPKSREASQGGAACGPAEGPAAGPAASGGQADEARMIEMLAELSAEDPPATRDYFTVSLGASLLMVALGAVLLVWGIAALVGSRRTGAVGSFAGTGLLLFGAGFFGGGVWMAYQTLKRRGVL